MTAAVRIGRLGREALAVTFWYKLETKNWWQEGPRSLYDPEGARKGWSGRPFTGWFI